MQELNKLSSKSPQHWHTYSATLKSITEEDGSKVYQQQPLQHFAEAEWHFSSHCEEYCIWWPTAWKIDWSGRILSL